ncbi:MAG: nucleotidyltransferase domain-containing protein [Peptococcaceae bacterium]|nr:nucleotidyltransferase domain-containing protein [Peptococcaceae bacterium]
MVALDQNSVRDTIIGQLRDTEQGNCVRIPLAVESGSRGWGFPSPDSDYDCRFVYVNEPDWYLSVYHKRDVIEFAADDVFDVNGWDVRKFIGHLVKSNAVMFEWLASEVVYIRDERIVLLWQRLAERFFDPVHVSHHYLSLAIKIFHKIGKAGGEAGSEAGGEANNEAGEGRLKKYFYVLRSLVNLRFIEHHGKMPYTDFFRTLKEIPLDKEIAEQIDDAAGTKMTMDESFVVPEKRVLTEFFAAEIARQEERLQTMKYSKILDREFADEVFRLSLKLAWMD